MSKNLIQNFRTTLIQYLQKPYDVKNKKNLTASAFAIYEHAVQSHNLEPDKFMTSIDEIVKVAVRGIKVHPYLAEVLDGFSRELSMLDKKQQAYAFHVLTITYNWYLKGHVIEPEQLTRNKLKRIEETIQLLKDNPYVGELETALAKLTALVNQYFKLSSAQQLHEHSVLEKKLKCICKEYQAAIASDVQFKSAVYNFLTVICRIFDVFGLSLANEFQRKNRLFQDASLMPKNTLSSFRVPFIKVEDILAKKEEAQPFAINLS